MKTYIQIIDTATGVYQSGMIDEPVVAGNEIDNAIYHFIGKNDIAWINRSDTENTTNLFGSIVGTSKVVTVTKLK